MLKIVEDKENKLAYIELGNDNIYVKLTNFGCTILRMATRNKDGEMQDVVLGFEDITDYMARDGSYLGALVGRCCNRIAKGHFRLGFKDYYLPINNGPNSLHGGIEGFSYKIFNYEILDSNAVRFTYLAKDGEEGYPGNLKLSVTYRLLKSALNIKYEATTDKDTIINITNHSYFNLSGKAQNVEDHYLRVDASKVGHVDKDGLFNGELVDVKDGPFDLRKETLISTNINQEDEQLLIAKGFDHHFIFDTDKDQVSLYSKESGIELTVSTTLPGAQIYSANYLSNPRGYYGQILKPRQAICIETQYIPDSINVETAPAVILRKDGKYESETTYKFEVRK